MKNLPLLLLFIAIALLQACQNAAPVRNETDVEATAEADTLIYVYQKIERKAGPCDSDTALCATFLAHYPVFTQTDKPVATAKINQRIVEALKANEAPDLKNADLEEVMRSFHAEYLRLIKEEPHLAQIWAKDRVVEVLTNTPVYLALSLAFYNNTGGAHPNGELLFQNIDPQTGDTLGLADIFEPNYQETLKQSGEKYFRKTQELQANQSLNEAGFWFPETGFQLNHNFAIVKNGLRFCFNPYEIGPYALGSTDFVIPFAELPPMKPKFAALAAPVSTPVAQ